MSAAVCPACHLALPSDGPVVRFCPSCGLNLATGQPAVGWIREGADLRQLARRQRLLIWFVLVVLLMQFAPLLARGLPPLGYTAIVATIVVVQVGIVVGVLYVLAAMRVHVVLRIICAVLMFAPCVHLIVLLIVNNRVTGMLQRSGLRVGLFGVSDDQLVRALGTNLCRHCGYSLIGNTTGICPECGTAEGGLPSAGQLSQPTPGIDGGQPTDTT